MDRSTNNKPNSIHSSRGRPTDATIDTLDRSVGPAEYTNVTQTTPLVNQRDETQLCNRRENRDTVTVCVVKQETNLTILLLKLQRE